MYVFIWSYCCFDPLVEFILTKQTYVWGVRAYVDWPSLITSVADMRINIYKWRHKNNPSCTFTFGSYTYIHANACMSLFALSRLLLLMFNGGSHQTFINLWEMRLTLWNRLTPFVDVRFPHNKNTVKKRISCP